MFTTRDNKIHGENRFPRERSVIRQEIESPFLVPRARDVVIRYYVRGLDNFDN